MGSGIFGTIGNTITNIVKPGINAALIQLVLSTVQQILQVCLVMLIVFTSATIKFCRLKSPMSWFEQYALMV
ncbi:MAG: hypothetical protein ACLRQF_21135 [Thomasclavelia ramosa]